MSPVFRRDSEYTFKIYSNEEERMHIHVLYDGHEAKYWLEPQVELAKNTGIRSVLNVQMSGPEAIEWPDLDVDLEIDSLRHPERYPLVIKRNPLDYVGV